MVQYYESKEAVEKAINNAKTVDELKKIVQDLEQRNAPHDWVVTAYNAYMRKL